MLPDELQCERIEEVQRAEEQEGSEDSPELKAEDNGFPVE